MSSSSWRCSLDMTCWCCARSDNGTEILNRSLAEFLNSKGVIHQTTARYTPEQNGADERLKRTLMERVRAMLEDSGLLKPYWLEAACTAVHMEALLQQEALRLQHEGVWSMQRPMHALVPKQLRRKLDKHS